MDAILFIIAIGTSLLFVNGLLVIEIYSRRARERECSKHGIENNQP